MFRIINVSERTCKLTWSGNWSNINGTGTVYYLPEGGTLYASPYLVITPQGYTKHYYAGAERITSQLGRGRFADVGTPVVGDSLVQAKLQAVTGNVRYPVTLTAPSASYFSYLDTLTNRQNDTFEAYWYHTDHLGSSSWITYYDGSAVQHLHYLPFGEDFVNKKSSSFEGARYTFSAKEKDAETKYSYFGARYYFSELSIWLSVDPQAAKYPHQSNYVYCSNNPLNLIDPNGEDEWEIDKKGNVNWICKSDEHRLYALDKNGKRTGNFITVKDKSSLEQLSQSRNDYDGHYSVCNKEDAFKIFKFGADNCDVEWAVAGYRKAGGGREYVVGTSNNNPDVGYSGSVAPFHYSSRFNKYGMIFEIHSHFGPDATQGASESDKFHSDMHAIRNTYTDYKNKGLPLQSGKGFPRYYVYTANTHILFNYTPWKPSVFIRNIEKFSDLYRNLSF